MSGSLTHSPAKVLQYFLVGQLVGSLPEDNDDWPIYCGQVPDAGDSIMAVLNTTSKLEGRLQYTGETQQHYGVQIIVRAPSSPAGWTKANTLMSVLDLATLEAVTVSSTPYTLYSISHNGAIAVGKDVGSSRRYLFTVNAMVALRENS